MTAFHYRKIQDDILQSLLSDQNSSVLSRKLGYKFNQVSRWMNHSKKLRWDEFVELCQVLHWPLETTLESVFGISVREPEDCKKTFVKVLLAQSKTKTSVGKALQKSRPTLYRIQRSKTVPDFISVLALMDLKPQRLGQFVTTLKTQDKKTSRRSPFDIPWFGVVSSAMAQKEHLSLPKFSPEWIAKRLNLSISQVEVAVQVMVENELIKWNGTHYEPTLPRTLVINHQRSQQDFLRTLRFWTERSLLAMNFHETHQTAADRFTGVFRTFMATKENVQQINLLIAELEEKIHNLLSSTDREKTEIRSFLMTHFDVSDT